MVKRLCYLVILLQICASIGVAAEAGLTVVFPEVKAPYDSIFQQIYSGIANQYDGPITKVRVSRKFDALSIAKSIKTDHVIALGRRGMSVARLLDDDKAIVVGALPIKPNGFSGVSLMSDPASLFDSLRELAPDIDNVIVLYTVESAWIMSSAQVIAKQKGLALRPIKVENIQAAVKTYNDLFEKGGLENSAIWLPLDSVTANDKIIVPAILEKAWREKIVVFSSKPTHAQRGALFSAIPDNEQLGGQLASMVVGNRLSAHPSTVDPVEHIKLAVNLRTATHLGFNYNSKERAGFELIFPN